MHLFEEHDGVGWVEITSKKKNTVTTFLRRLNGTGSPVGGRVQRIEAGASVISPSVRLNIFFVGFGLSSGSLFTAAAAGGVRECRDGLVGGRLARRDGKLFTNVPLPTLAHPSHCCVLAVVCFGLLFFARATASVV